MPPSTDSAAQIRTYEFEMAVLVDRIYDDLVEFAAWMEDARNATGNVSDATFEAVRTNLDDYAAQARNMTIPTRHAEAHAGLEEGLQHMALLYEAGWNCIREDNTSACRTLPPLSDALFQSIESASRLGRLTHLISAYLNHAAHDWKVEVHTDTHNAAFTARANREERVEIQISCSSVMSHVRVTLTAAESRTTSETFRRACGNGLPYFISISENDWGEVFVQHLQDPEG